MISENVDWMTNDLKNYVARETLKSCEEQLNNLNNANKKIRSYMLSNDIDANTELKLNYALQEIYNQAKWLSSYSKYIRTKYTYYAKI